MLPKNFFEELKRRNVFKVASIYAVTAWLIIQIVATTFPMFEFPTWSQRLIVILILAGFPIALILAWAQESVAKESIEVDDEDAEGQRLKIKWVTPAVVGVLGLIGVVLWLTRSTVSEKGKLLPAEIREEKVAVSVFANRTNDEDLDALGYLASEWISSGLRELDIRTVSPEMVRQHKDQIGVLPNNATGEPSFAEITGAKYIISGSYFLAGDSLILNTRLSSTETGEELKTFPKLVGRKDQKEQLVEEARQYLLGYWVLKRDQKLPTISPPKYEAYKAYLKCFIAHYWCFQDVVTIDPNFMLARAYLVSASGSWGMDSVYLANKSFIEKRWDQCTEFEKNVFRFGTYRYERKAEAAFRALDANFRLDSNDYLTVHQTADLAAVELNRMDIAIQRYEGLFDKIELFEDQINVQSFIQYLTALNRNGDYGKVIAFYSDLSEELKEKAGDDSLHEFMIALLYQNRIEEVEKLIDDKGGGMLYLYAAYMYTYIFPDAAENPFFEGTEAQIEKAPDLPQSLLWGWPDLTTFRNYPSKFFFHYLMGNWTKAEIALEKLKAFDWEGHYEEFNVPRSGYKGEQLWLAAAFGCVYAHQGRVEESYAQIQLLEELGAKYNDGTHVPFFRGGTAYLKARIYAVLGEKDKAVEALHTSIEQGRLYIWWNIYFDIDFVNLKAYPPFEELIRPKGRNTNLMN